MEEEIKAFMKVMITKVVRKVRRDIWRENNKELYRARQRVYGKKYYKKVKEKNKEIFRKRSEAWRENNPEKYSEGQIKWHIKKKLKRYKDNEGGIRPQPDRGYFMPGKGKIYLGRTESLAWRKGFDVGEALGEIKG